MSKRGGRYCQIWSFLEVVDDRCVISSADFKKSKISSQLLCVLLRTIIGVLTNQGL